MCDERQGPLLICVAATVTSPSDVLAAECKQGDHCEGCGCEGGPGYRAPNGKCVGFKNLAKLSGTPPEMRCVFENAQGTGVNRDCVLGKSDSDEHDAE
ncbi:hypothetical protein [Allorhizobium terrae]|uniref:hypothetical protein n=1 Tax=Allorhizobium terrae TaxID=1848972 RepID=UPI00167ED627|nr:hypothetical protein [Allorhizobium terrae]